VTIADGFWIVLDCDFCPDQRQKMRGEFCERNATEAYRAVRAAGWKLYPAQSKAKCRRCSSKPSLYAAALPEQEKK